MLHLQVFMHTQQPWSGFEDSEPQHEPLPPRDAAAQASHPPVPAQPLQGVAGVVCLQKSACLQCVQPGTALPTAGALQAAQPGAQAAGQPLRMQGPGQNPAPLPYQAVAQPPLMHQAGSPANFNLQFPSIVPALQTMLQQAQALEAQHREAILAQMQAASATLPVFAAQTPVGQMQHPVSAPQQPTVYPPQMGSAPQQQPVAVPALQQLAQPQAAQPVQAQATPVASSPQQAQVAPVASSPQQGWGPVRPVASTGAAYQQVLANAAQVVRVQSSPPTRAAQVQVYT